MKISFGITTNNEGVYVQELLDQLIPYCESIGDEIVIIDDYSTDAITLEQIYDHPARGIIRTYSHSLENDFSKHKNFLNSMCEGDYIFQIDADEKLNNNLLTYLHDIVENNTNIDLFTIPRVNVVNGLTDDDIKRWGWQVNEQGWVMFPDYQTRLYKNSPDIRWEGTVHERIVGYKTMAPLPAEEEWSLYHIKDIIRQRQQNNYYATITR